MSPYNRRNKDSIFKRDLNQLNWCFEETCSNLERLRQTLSWFLHDFCPNFDFDWQSFPIKDVPRTSKHEKLPVYFSNLTFEKINSNFISNLDIEWLGFMQKFWTFMAYVFLFSVKNSQVKNFQFFVLNKKEIISKFAKVFSIQKVFVIWSTLPMAKNFTSIHGNSKFHTFCKFYLVLKVTDVTVIRRINFSRWKSLFLSVDKSEFDKCLSDIEQIHKSLRLIHQIGMEHWRQRHTKMHFFKTIYDKEIK